MPDNPPRRKKIAAILLLLDGRTIANLDEEKGGTVEEIALSYLCRSWSLFDTTESEWGSDYNNLYSFISSLGDDLTETSTLDVEGYLGDFENLLELADL